jgi:predicted Zn-dependent protease
MMRLALICCCALAQAVEEGSAEWHRNTGLASYRAGQIEKTLEHLQKAIRLDPAKEQYYLDLGQVLAENHARTAVVTVFEAARAALPDSLRIQSALGVAYLTVRDYERAKQVFTGMLQAHPEDEQAYQLLAECSDITRDWAGAAETAARLRARNPRNTHGWYYGAAAEYELRKSKGESLQTAEWYVQRSLALTPSDWRSHLLLGKILGDTLRDEGAVQALRRAIHLRGNDPRIHYILAQALQRLGRTAESKAAFAAYRRARAARNANERALMVEIR